MSSLHINNSRTQQNEFVCVGGGGVYFLTAVLSFLRIVTLSGKLLKILMPA
jgi:hypothetical protein